MIALSPKVDKDELDQVLSTYRQLYQRPRAEAELVMQSLRLPDVPQRDDVPVGTFGSVFDWDSED